MTISLNKEDIKRGIPHRFENLLLDHLEINDNKDGGTSTVRISTSDPEGRDIFLKNHSPSKCVLIRPVMMEILALGSILSCGGVRNDQIVFFASVKNFVIENDLPEGLTATSSLKLLSKKQRFIRYRGMLSYNDNPLCSCDLMAFYNTKEEFNNSQKVHTQDLSLPTMSRSYAMDKNDRVKHPLMYHIDSLCHYDADEAIVHGIYTYPVDHPFTKGHFPDNPVMMGVMQLVGIEDLCLCLVQYLDMSNTEFSITCNAVLYNDQGIIVSEANNVTVTGALSKDHDYNYSDLQNVERVLFKQPIRPGDTIFICLNNVRIS